MVRTSNQASLPFTVVEQDQDNCEFASRYVHQNGITYEMALNEYLKDINMKQCAAPEIGKYGVRPLIESCPRAYFEWFMRPEYVRKTSYYEDLKVWEKLDEGRVIHDRLLNIPDPKTREPFFDVVEQPIDVEVKMSNMETITIRGIVDAIKGVMIEGFNDPFWIPHELKIVSTLPRTKLPPINHRLQINFYVGALKVPHGKLLYWGSPSGWSRERELVSRYIKFSEPDYKSIINKAKSLHLAIRNVEPPRCECRGASAGKHEFI